MPSLAVEPESATLSALQQRRARVERKRDRLIAQIADVHAELQALAADEAQLRAAAAVEPASTPTSPSTKSLSGPSIRLAAYHVVRPGDPPMHYRAWYRKVLAAGHTIIGKDPAATFLSALSRSPIVKQGPKPGEYLLDLAAITPMLEELQATNDALASESSVTGLADGTRDARLRALSQAQRRILRQLEELRDAGLLPTSIHGPDYRGEDGRHARHQVLSDA